MGHVFEAWDTALRVRIGLKTIRPEIADHPASLARFRQEVLTARSLSHPNICRTFDLERETRVLDPIRGTEQAIIFLTMEFLEGETLADRLSRTGALTEDEAFAIARQIAGALACAHDHGIVHGDIKPANVMLVRRAGATSDPTHVPVMDLRVVVTDFGLARVDPLSVLVIYYRSLFLPLGRPTLFPSKSTRFAERRARGFHVNKSRQIRVVNDGYGIWRPSITFPGI